MMRKVLLSLFLLFSISAFAQETTQGNFPGAYRYKNRLYIDSILLLPNQNSSTPIPLRDGALRYNPSTGFIQLWKNSVWINIVSDSSLNNNTYWLRSGGSIIPKTNSDTVKMNTVYMNSGDTTSIYPFYLNVLYPNVNRHSLNPFRSNLRIAYTSTPGPAVNGPEGTGISGGVIVDATNTQNLTHVGLGLNGGSFTAGQFGSGNVALIGGVNVQLGVVAGSVTDGFFYKTQLSNTNTIGTAWKNVQGFWIPAALNGLGTLNSTGFLIGIAHTGHWNAYYGTSLNNYMGSGNTLINDTLGDGASRLYVNGQISSNGNTVVGKTEFFSDNSPKLASTAWSKHYADSLVQIDTVQNIGNLYTYTGRAKILLVKDSIRGGTFYKTGFQNVSDSGTVFGSWNRQYQKGIVHVGWFGGKTGTHIQQAINVADTGGVIYLQPKSRYMIYATINPINGQRVLGNFDTLQRCNEVKAVLQTAISIGSGNRVFSVSSATGFTIGGLVNFYSAANSNGSTAVHKILSISGNTITTDSALSYDQAYAVGDTVITEFTMIANPFGGGGYLKNVAIENIVFDGNKTNNPSHIYWAFNAAASLYCDNLKVNDCYFINSKADGLIMGGDNPIVTHCQFLNGNSNGVHLSGTYHPVICNNYFYNNNLNINTLHNEGHITFSDSIFQADIYSNYFRKTALSGVGRVGSSLNGGSSNVSIHDNVFDSCLFASVNIGNASVLNPSIFNFNISNNRIYNCGRLGVTGIGGTLDRAFGPGRANLIGNLFVNSFVAVTRANNINLSDNTFYKDASFVASQASYVFLIDNENITITGNHFMGNIAYALACDNSATTSGTYKDKGYLISSNDFIDQSIRSIQFVSKNSGTFENIKISNNNFKNSVSNNAIVNIGSGIEFSYNTMNVTGASASTAIATQFNGTSLLDSAKNVLIKGNTIRITSGYAIRVGYGTGIQIINNQYNIGSNVTKPVQDSSNSGAYYAYNKITDSAYTGVGLPVPLANFHTSGSVRLDLGSDAKYDTYYRDSTTSNLVRSPAGAYGQFRYSGPGGLPQWHTLSAGDIGTGYAGSGALFLRDDNTWSNTLLGPLSTNGNTVTGKTEFFNENSPKLASTAWSKHYTDSIAGLKVNVSDTAVMLAGYALLSGRSGGQILAGSNAGSGNETLTLKATPGTSTSFIIDSSSITGGGGPVSANTVFKASKTFINPTSNPNGFRGDITAILTTGSYAGGILGAQLTPTIGVLNTQNWTGAAAIQGFSAAPTITSGATGTITGVIGGTFTPNLSSSGTTVTNLIGLRVYNTATLGTITNNTMLLLGQSTAAAGTWNIYTNSTANSYFGTGNMLVNSNTDIGLGEKLQVNGRISALRATQANDVVTKPQLDSLAGIITTPTLQQITSSTNGNNTNQIIQIKGLGGAVLPGYALEMFMDSTSTPKTGDVNAINRPSGAPIELRLNYLAGTYASPATIRLGGAGNDITVVGGNGIDSGHTNLITSGSHSFAITTITNSTILDNTYFTVLGNNSSNIVITLPTASSCTGRIYHLKKISNNANTITINAATGVTIDGSATTTITSYNQSLTVQSSGTVWVII